LKKAEVMVNISVYKQKKETT